MICREEIINFVVFKKYTKKTKNQQYKNIFHTNFNPVQLNELLQSDLNLNKRFTL